MTAVARSASATPPLRPNRIEELQKTVSASRLGCWQQCRLKFYFRYVLKIVKPPTPALHVGKVVHAVLQAWNKARWRRESFDITQSRASFDANWIAQQAEQSIRWKEDETTEQTGAWSMLETYFQATPIPADEKPQAVEVRVEADLSKHGLPVLVGIIDLVRAGGRIVDFKTSAKTPNAAQAFLLHEVQLASYSVLYREATGATETGLELHHLVKLKTPKVVVASVGPMEAVRQTRLFRVIESYLEGLSRKDFVPSPGMGCFACEYCNECAAWNGKEPDA